MVFFFILKRDKNCDLNLILRFLH